MTFAELRAAGIKRPAAVVYELELAGHRITRRPNGIGLGEDEPKKAPAPPRPRIRVRRRDDGHSDKQATRAHDRVLDERVREGREAVDLLAERSAARPPGGRVLSVVPGPDFASATTATTNTKPGRSHRTCGMPLIQRRRHASSPAMRRRRITGRSRIATNEREASRSRPADRDPVWGRGRGGTRAVWSAARLRAGVGGGRGSRGRSAFHETASASVVGAVTGYRRVFGFLTYQEVALTREDLESIPETTAAERAVADLMPIHARQEEARAALEHVPLWFHTFSLDGAGVYTPGIARDHRYRLASIPDELTGARVLDVGTFDGFYAFLAERRGAARVVAVDNEQYVAWVRGRFGIDLEPGAGFRAIAALLGSKVDYRRLDALDVDRLGETFDVILCFGILHRVESPLTLMRVLGECLAPDGRIILETYGVRGGHADPCVLIHERGDVYARDDAVYWGFSRSSLDRLARVAGLRGFELVAAPEIAGHPRIIGTLEKG
jgi:tRNA (mo5U34)-methyltransferase